MPTYEYLCPDCDHRFEEFQSITAPAISKCPACGKKKVKRLIGRGSGVIFRGNGFYQTDYRSASYKKAAQADTESSSAKSSDSKSGSTEGTKAKSKSADSTTKSDSTPTAD